MENENKKPLISQYLGLSIDLRREFLKKGQNEIAELIRFIISLMGTLGIIAGFGFTAFQFILSPVLFFTGETLIIGVVIYLAFKIKATLVHYAVDTETYINHWVNKATEIRKALVDKNTDDIQRLEKELTDSMTDITEPPQFVGATTVRTYLNNSLVVASIGAIALITSFIICF